MNYSYVMGVNNIDILIENGFEIENFKNNYGVSFPNEKIEVFEKYIYDTLKNGFWNEYLGEEKVFIFKFKDGKIKKYILNDENKEEILELCSKFANCKFESIDKMLMENSFYSKTYYNTNKSTI